MIYLLQQVAILNASVFQIHWTVLIYAQANWLTCCGQHAITGGDEARAMAVNLGLCTFAWRPCHLGRFFYAAKHWAWTRYGT